MQLGADNTKSIGLFLYTDYFIIFQISGFLLLLAMIGAIVLAHHDYSNEKEFLQLNKKKLIRKQLLN